jgi:mRNA-degrading endonuclease YafQ of YafQ-DinJ toxin-antitoxin module
VKRLLISSATFIRATKKMLRKKPALAPDIHEALSLLEKDAFHPYLRTHKLTGNLQGSLACSAGIFEECLKRLCKNDYSPKEIIYAVYYYTRY